MKFYFLCFLLPFYYLSFKDVEINNTPNNFMNFISGWNRDEIFKIRPIKHDFFRFVNITRKQYALVDISRYIFG